jgi:hypothetical protein
MIMESMNNTQNHTLGLIQNVRLTLGPILLSLQIQVIEDAPFEVLLGQPFFALSSCITEDSTDGESYITICDPNIGECAKFITHAQQPKPSPVHALPSLIESSLDFH